MSVNTDMLGSYDFTGGGGDGTFDMGSYDFSSGGFDTGSLGLDLGGGGGFDFNFGGDQALGGYDFGMGAGDMAGQILSDAGQGAMEFDLNEYIDFDDNNWDLSLDDVLDDEQWSGNKMPWEARAEDEYTGLTSEETAAQGEAGVSEEQEYKPISERIKDEGMFKSKFIDESQDSAQSKITGEQDWEREAKDTIASGGSYERNGWVYSKNPITGEIERNKAEGSWMDNEGLLKMLAVGGMAGLSFLGKSSETDMQKKMFDDKMQLERDKMQHQLDFYNLKQSYKGGGGGGAAPTAAAGHNAALASMSKNSRRGNFTRR